MSLHTMLTPERTETMRAAGLWEDRLVTDFLDDTARDTPDALAVVDHNAVTGVSTRLSYAALRARSLRLACELQALGIGPGDVVAVQLPNWWHYAALYPACARIGAIVNPLMPIFRERELEFMLGFAEARAIVIPREFRGHDYPAMIERLRPSLPRLEHVLVVDGGAGQQRFEDLLTRAWEDEPDIATRFDAMRPDPDAVTEIMYTSGTTGQPKGVMHTANTLTCKARLATELFGFTREDAVFMGSPLAHQTGFMYAVVFSIVNGTTCVLQDVWEPEAAAALIETERCTVTLGSTPFLADLVDVLERGAGTLSCLRLFLCAGAPIPSVLVEQARTAAPGLYVMSAWGMTEMGIATATYPGDPDEKVVGTDGRALPHQAVRVVDANGEAVPPDTEGRLEARCATTFVGYLKRPEAYGVNADGWLDTGDNACMDADGYIRITGRSKDIIIRGGENVPVVEVEALLHRHPAVTDCALVAMPDPRLGERGCAFVSLREGAELDFDAMIAHLTAFRIARQYLPERLEIVREFPRTPSGKIQKFILRERAAELAADPDGGAPA